jgi:hypothetical protein
MKSNNMVDAGVCNSNPVRVALILNDLGWVLTTADKLTSSISDLQKGYGE